MPSVPDDRLTIVAGDGANVQTDDGRWLLDATAGLWHANIGHGRARLADAAAAQMRRLETYHTFGRITNDQALLLADRVAVIRDGKIVADASPRVLLSGKHGDYVDELMQMPRRRAERLQALLDGKPAS